VLECWSSEVLGAKSRGLGANSKLRTLSTVPVCTKIYLQGTCYKITGLEGILAYIIADSKLHTRLQLSAIFVRLFGRTKRMHLHAERQTARHSHRPTQYKQTSAETNR
jgi:hypothetical protein